MRSAHEGDVTKLLNALGMSSGRSDGVAFERVYSELKTIAAGLLSKESDRGVLQTTVLVHDALLRLRQFEQDGQQWENRAHFFGSAAKAMRRILIDEARRRRAERKRIVMVEHFVFVAGGDTRPVEIDLLDLDEAMSALDGTDPGLCEILSLRVFGDLSMATIGDLVGLGEDQVRRRMRLAQAWLIRWLREHRRIPGGIE